MVAKTLSNEQLTNEIAIVLGTRPGIVKFAPIIRELETRALSYFLIHTGQHYSYNMDAIFFKELDLPMPTYINPLTKLHPYHGSQTAEMLRFTEAILIDRKPSTVIVGGDANTNLAGALAARKLGLTLCHLEAGLRSKDWRMPEEHNRVVIDHISDILLAPTEHAAANLARENVTGKVYIVGNTIVDAVQQNVQLTPPPNSYFQSRTLPARYCLLTIHREEVVDNIFALQRLITNVRNFALQLDIEVIFPVHPRTLQPIYKMVMGHKWVWAVDPLGYLDFIKLLNGARFVMTDSGGVQEEACILKVPCLTLRNNTERPETVEVGANLLVNEDGSGLTHQDTVLHISKARDWENPFGDGTSACKICDILKENAI